MLTISKWIDQPVQRVRFQGVRAVAKKSLLYSVCLPSIFFLAAFWCTLASAQTNTSVGANLDQQTTSPSRGSSASASSSTGPIALPENFGQLRIGEAFLLNFEVDGVPELSQQLTVEGGNIVVPLLGPVQVEGDSLRTAEGKIAKLLVDGKLLNNPLVHLRILQFSKPYVTVAGEVQSPGRVLLLSPRSVVDVLALVGGETTAAGGTVDIRRIGAAPDTEIEQVPYTNGRDSAVARNTLVYPGDEVYVRRSGVVYVLGEVQKPGGYLMVHSGTLSVAEAVSLAQGTTAIASLGEAVVIRRNDNKLERITVSLKKQERGEDEAVQLKDGDMLYVATNKIKSAFVTTQGIIGAALASAIIASSQR
ncbi:polysaccharide biosynthesis/export family protein [Granulicella rosea]